MEKPCGVSEGVLSDLTNATWAKMGAVNVKLLAR